MKIISYMVFIGGQGKTIGSICCAHSAAAKGHRVVLVDGDIQGSATARIKRYYNYGESKGAIVKLTDKLSFAPIGSYKAISAKVIKSFDADYVIIDCPSYPRGENEVILPISDVVAIPVKPESASFTAAYKVMKQIEFLREKGRNIRAIVVPNLVSPWSEPFNRLYDDKNLQVLKECNLEIAAPITKSLKIHREINESRSFDTAIEKFKEVSEWVTRI